MNRRASPISFIRAFFGGAWHGPSVKEALDTVGADAAVRHSISEAHSIWELVHHLRAWIVEAAATARGKAYESLKGEKDWPPVRESSVAEWSEALSTPEIVLLKKTR